MSRFDLYPINALKRKYFALLPFVCILWAACPAHAGGEDEVSLMSNGASLGMTILFMLCAAAVAALVGWWWRGNRAAALNRALAEVLEAACDGQGGACQDATAVKGAAALNGSLTRALDVIGTLGASLSESRGAVEDLGRRLAREEERMRQGRESFVESRRRDLANASRTLERAIVGIQAVSSTLGGQAGAARGRADDQQALVNGAAASMEEMNASIAEVADAAGRATSDAETARERAAEGGDLVGRTVASITLANERTARLSQGLSDLGQKAEGIGDIMDVISDIADQTNLLALNAAIEAARAGEAGRGFAVVADEVRKLAEKTMTATREVGGRIESIQVGVRSSLGEMEEALEMVGEAAELAGVSGKALEEIVSLAESTSSQVHNIAAATSQQSAASEEINRVVSQVNDISVTTAEGMARSEEAVRELTAKVDDLARMNSVFRFIGQGTVQKALSGLVASSDMVSMDRERQERLLKAAIRDNEFLELLYVTDAHGRQTVSNIPRPGRESAADRQAFGADWSGREWFKVPAASGTLFVSDVYVSSATGEDCITVSEPFFAPDGNRLGIVAADVSIGAA